MLSRLTCRYGVQRLRTSRNDGRHRRATPAPRLHRPGHARGAVRGRHRGVVAELGTRAADRRHVRPHLRLRSGGARLERAGPSATHRRADACGVGWCDRARDSRVASPCVLVGHSFGSFLVYAYAATHPGKSQVWCYSIRRVNGTRSRDDKAACCGAPFNSHASAASWRESALSEAVSPF